jgi:hypothetical protein
LSTCDFPHARASVWPSKVQSKRPQVVRQPATALDRVQPRRQSRILRGDARRVEPGLVVVVIARSGPDRAVEVAPQVSDAEDIRRIISERQIEFLFAQFVDMHGKPSAKLVPAHHIDDLLTEGAGFAGFAAGDIGQGPHDPDLIAIPDPRSHDADDPALAAERNAVRLRRDGRGRALAVLPAHDPAQPLARAKALRFELKMGAEFEYFLIRRTEDGGIEVADTLELPC